MQEQCFKLLFIVLTILKIRQAQTERFVNTYSHQFCLLCLHFCSKKAKIIALSHLTQTFNNTALPVLKLFENERDKSKSISESQIFCSDDAFKFCLNFVYVSCLTRNIFQVELGTSSSCYPFITVVPVKPTDQYQIVIATGSDMTSLVRVFLEFHDHYELSDPTTMLVRKMDDSLNEW